MSFRSNPSGRPFLPPGNQCQIQGQGHSPHWMMMKAHQVAMVEPCCLIGHIDDVLMLETELDILFFRNHDVASVVAALLASGVLRVWAETDHRRAHLFSLLPFRRGRLEVCEFLQAVAGVVLLEHNGFMVRTTPSNIESLPANGVFVFGSNREGAHGAGAAHTAVIRFDAVMGVGEGLQGQSYGLPTMEGLEEFRLAAERFAEFARSHPDLEFWLTKVGCGIAGYSEDEVRPMVEDTPENVIKPPGW